MRLSEAQQLFDVINDPLFTAAFREFLQTQHNSHISMLLVQIRQKDRDTMKEAFLSGKVDVYETLWYELGHFANRMMKESQ